jgi:hypothetical protein
MKAQRRMSDCVAVSLPLWRYWRAGIALLAGLWVGTVPRGDGTHLAPE